MSELTPITRKETFLAKAGGQDVVTPEPITRTEQFLQAIIDNGGGGGGTGGGAASINVTNVPYLAQALQTAVTAAVTAGVTSHANEAIYYFTNAESANIVADMETLSAFLTENEGKNILLVFDGSYQPVTYSPSGHYIGFAMKGYQSPYAYNFDIAIAPSWSGDTISGASFNLYGWATTNIIINI